MDLMDLMAQAAVEVQEELVLMAAVVEIVMAAVAEAAVGRKVIRVATAAEV
jgi:hypothetical protein